MSELSEQLDEASKAREGLRRELAKVREQLREAEHANTQGRRRVSARAARARRTARTGVHPPAVRLPCAKASGWPRGTKSFTLRQNDDNGDDQFSLV